MTMTRRRLLDDTFKKSVVGNPAIATDSLARMYPGIEMQGWTEQDGTPTPENPVPIVSAGTKNQENGKWEHEIEVGCGQLAENSVVSHPEGEYVPDKIIFSGNITGEYTISLEEVGEVSYTQPGAGIIKITINGKDEIVGKYQLPYTFSGNITEITVFSSGSYIMFAGTIKFMFNPGSTPLPYTPYRPPQTVTLTADRPLTKWDKLEKRNGQWGWVYKSEEIESYTDESVPGEYFSTTGQLSTGAQVWYKTTTETFAPLTTAEQEAMNALYTYRPTTVLSNQQDCQMTLTYKTRKGMS